MSVLTEAIFGGVVSKVINDAGDVSKVKIIDAVKNSKHQNLESQIYNVMVSVLNKITYNQYENDQDKIYDVAEKILKGFKRSENNNKEYIVLGLRNICKNVDKNKYTDFMELLYRELSKDRYSELYREIRLLQQEKEDNKTSRIEQKIDVAIQKIDDGNNNGKVVPIQNQEKKFQNNKKKYYIKKWNSRLFLHLMDEKRPLTLSQTFIMPPFKIHKNIDIVGTSTIAFNLTIDKFVTCNRSSNMLIIGVPGIGKSSVVSWMANRYKLDDRFIILRFRDWEYDELKNGLLKAICIKLCCKNIDLNNKVLILDGFDEMKTLNIRQQLIAAFLNDILDLENFKCIVTSRPNYIELTYFQNVIELQYFDVIRIKKYYRMITGVDLNIKKERDFNPDIIDLKSKENILGVPVILYMAIMSNIDIEKGVTKPQLYDRVFAKEGGIFDRFSDEGLSYDEGSHPLRNSINIKKYLAFLMKTAFIMFCKNDLCLSKDEYQIPKLDFQGNKVDILEFPIKYIFENTKGCIEFVHKSIYEYFVAKYIFTLICKAINLNLSKKKLAGIFGELLKIHELNYEIIDYLKYKTRNSKLYDKFNVINETFQLMLHDGMTYYTNKRYKKVVNTEMIIFYNMLCIIGFWEEKYIVFDNSICDYLRYNVHSMLHFDYVNLNGLNLRNARLHSASFYKTSLKKANLEGAELDNAMFCFSDMRAVNLSYSSLKVANFDYADLRNADLRGAHIKNDDILGVTTVFSEAIIDEAQLIHLNYKCDLRNMKVCLSKTKEIIKYEEYCKS